MDEALANVGGGTGNVSSETVNSIVVVDDLPATEEEGVMYFVKRNEDFNVLPIFTAKSVDANGATYSTDGTDRCMMVNGTPTSSSYQYTQNMELPLLQNSYYLFKVELISGSADGTNHDGEIADFTLVGKDTSGNNVQTIHELEFTSNSGSTVINSFVLETTSPLYAVSFRIKSNTIYENAKFKITIIEV